MFRIQLSCHSDGIVYMFTCTHWFVHDSLVQSILSIVNIQHSKTFGANDKHDLTFITTSKVKVITASIM